MSMLNALKEMQAQSQNTTPVEARTLVLGETLSLQSVGYYAEKPSPKGNGIIPATFYGKLLDGGMVRLQNEAATLWYEGLKEAMVELGFKDGVLKYEGEITDARFKGATWIFDVEPGYVGKEAKYKSWGDDSEAFEVHGGMLAGPVTIRIREHKPPKRATYTDIKLGYDE